MKYREQGLEGINFIIAGALANGVSFIAFSLFFYITKVGGFYSSVIGQSLGLTASYLYNTRRTFKRRLTPARKVMYYSYYSIALILVAQGIDFLILLKYNPQISWLACVTLAVVINYCTLKFIIFRY